MVKAHELRDKKKHEILAQLKDLKTELTGLRVAKVTGAPSKLAKIKTVRKSIARVHTVMNQTQREQLRAHYKKHNRRLPLDLRKKQTRAIRQRLTLAERTAVTPRAAKKAAHFPQRKFAVKASK